VQAKVRHDYLAEILSLATLMRLASKLDEYLVKRIVVISVPTLLEPINRARAAELVSEWKGVVECNFVVPTRPG
jgi:hypothetical protein